MKKLLLTIFTLLLISSNLWSQGSVTATYSLGDIPTDRSFTSIGSTSSCPGLLDVVIPAGRIVSSVDVSYDMTAGSEWMSEQRSWLYCSTTTTGEAAVYSGAGNGGGTYSYSRSGLTIADGAQGTISFEMHAGRSYGGSGCSTIQNQVDDGTWTITVNHIPTPSCADASATMSNITATGATATWAAANGAASYDWEVVPTGNAQGVGVVVSGSGETGLTASITGLTANTGYDFLISSDCTTDYASAITFTTTWAPYVGCGDTDYDTGGPNGNYSNNEDYTITYAPDTSGDIVTIDIDYISIEGNYDFLSVYDGADINATQLSAEVTADVSFTASTGNGITIRFTSDFSGSYAGYSLTSSCAAPPSCQDASATMSNITATGATATWDAANGAASYDWEVVPTGNAQGAGVVASGSGETGLTVSITGLTAQTTYDFLISSDCTTEYASAVSFTTSCGAISLPYSEDFENAGSAPDCWTVSSSSARNWSFSTSGTFGNTISDNTTGSGYFAIVDASTTAVGTDITLESAFVDVSTLNAPSLKFYLHHYAGSGASNSISVDVYDGSSWTTVHTDNTNDTNSWEEVLVSLSSLTITGNVKVRFVVDTATAANYLNDIGVDDVSFVEAPSCLSPSAFADPGYGDITTTTVDLAWTLGDSETLWDLELVDVTASGSATGTPTTEDVTTNPYTLTGLTANNDYQVYLRADCSGDNSDTSDWVGPVSFTTLCNEVADISENFDAAAAIPDCFDTIVSGTVNASVGITTLGSTSGTNSIRLNKYPSSDVATLVLPPVSTLGDNYRLTFNVMNYAGSGSGVFDVGTVDANGTFTSFQEITITSNVVWEFQNIDFSSYAGTDTNLAITGIYNDTSGTTGYLSSSFIDDVVWEEIPSCLNVSNISETYIDETSTTISFTDDNDPTPSNGWDYELLDITAGEVTGGGTLGNFTSTSNTLSGLTGAGNDYEIIITTNCGGVFTDITSPPVSFTWTQGDPPGTTCSVPIVAVAGTYSDVTVFDNANNATNSGADGAIWYSFTPTEDGSIDVSSCASNPTGVDTRLWLYTDGCTTLTAVDSDDDGCDNPNTYGSVVTGVAVSSGQEYLIEWDNRWSSGEFDWTLTFTPAPDCADVTNITQVQPTTTSATISWSDSVNPTVDGGYDYELLDITAGQVAGEGITGNSTTLSLELTGLTGSHNEYTINLTTVCNAFSNSPGTSFSWVQDPVLGYDCSAPITVLEGVNSAVFSTEGAGNIWYEFDAPADYGGTLSISACITGTDTYLQMWDDCDSFNSGSDDYCGFGSGLIDVPVARSQSYKFQWLNFYSSANFDFEFIFTPTPGSVCTAAIEAQVGTNTTNYTTSAGYNTDFGDEVVHFSYTPASDGVMTISSCNATSDTIFYIADGCGNYIGTSDDDCGLQSTLTLSVTASQELKIYWAGWYNQDTFDWTLEYAASGSWTGATSTDWSESSNWATGALPSSSNDITIGTGLTNYPIIGSSTDANINNITVSSGASLTIDETSSLTVSGDFTNNGTVTLNSTEDDFSSLIVTGTATGDIVYNRFVNVYDDTAGGGWDLVSSPVGMTIADFITANGANIQVIGDDYAFSQFNNATGQWERYAQASQDGSFTTGQGYSMATTTGTTVAFTGAMETTSQSIDIINNSGLNNVGRRWNLVSNPFPSYIAGNTAAATTNFMDANSSVIDSEFLAVYGWDGSSYTIYNQLSGAFSMAPGQGFWVAAASTSNAGLDFTAAMRTTTGNGDFVSGPQLLTYNVALKLYNGETEKAATNFYFRDGLSLGLDPGYDAAAFNQSMALSTRLAQGSQETAFSINAMDIAAMQNIRVPLEIRQSAGQSFRVSIADMELPEDIYVYLEDTANGTLSSLKDGDFELTAQSNLSGSDRFFIVFKSNSVLSNGNTLGINALNVYKANTESFVTIAGITPDLGKLNATLYSIVGATVREKALNTATATQTLSTEGLASGLYIIQLRSGNQVFTKKIIVE